MSAWTSALLDQAVTWWREGKSATEIAAGLRKCGVVFTRNAVIGKLHRAGATNKNRATGYGLGTGERKKRTNVRKPKTAGFKYERKTDPAEIERKQQAARAARDAAIARVEVSQVESPNARPWMERKPGECKWPIGERHAVMSCCNPIAVASFCEGHAAVGYQQLKTRPDGTQLRSHSVIEGQALFFTRFERTDHYHRSGTGKPHAKPAPSNWDDGRAAA